MRTLQTMGNRALRLRREPDTWALLAVATAVLLANLPYLLGIFDPNPLHFRSELTSALTPGLLPGRPTIDPSNGFTSQAIGHLAALDLLHLRLPWWNPYEGTGMPLAGETQAAALFPPTLLTAISGGQLYEHVLLELIAGVCTFRLLRRLSVARPAAVAGAIAFALCGKFAWFADATVNPLPFLPMMLLGIERAWEASREGRRGGWRLLALAGALSVYAGFPEVAYIDGLMAICWAGWRCACAGRGRLRALLTKLALAAVSGTLLAAPMLVAMVDYLPRADLGIHAGSQLGQAHLPFSAVGQLLMPYLYGQVNTNPHSVIWIRSGGYLSVLLVLLAVLGLLAPGRRGLKLVLLAWGLLVFSRMYGQPPVLGRVLGLLPDMSRIQFFRYGTAALELPVILLAALGLDGLALSPSRVRRSLWSGLAVMLALAGAALLARPLIDPLGSRHGSAAFFYASIGWGIFSASAVVALARMRGTRERAIALAVLVALEAVGLFTVPELAAPRNARVELAAVAYLRSHLAEQRFFTLGPIRPDYGSYFELGSLAVDDFPPRRYADFVRAHLDPGAAFTGFRAPDQPSAEQELMRHLDGYRAAGVSIVLTPAGHRLPSHPRGLRPLLRTASTWIYGLSGALPYFSGRNCRVVSAVRESAEATCRRRTTVVRRETWFPGWSARVDGRAAQIRLIDGLYQGVTVPPGRHRITFSFRPVGMGWAELCLVVGCLLLGVPSVLRRTRRAPGATDEAGGGLPQATAGSETAATTSSSAATTAGSNWDPAQARSSSCARA